MDIVSDVGFTLKIKNKEAEQYFFHEEEIYRQTSVGFKIEENEAVDILFNSTDPQARLYLEALDIAASRDYIEEDEFGRLYRTPTEEPVPLFENNNLCDALRVDFFRIMIIENGQSYYSLLEVTPKQLSKDQWNILRDDLEKEMIGLSQDFVRRNIGMGLLTSNHLPPKKLYAFLVIQKYSISVLGALTDLTEKPKYQLRKEYRKSLKNKAIEFDSETIKRYLSQGMETDHWDVPVKIVSYDIQENRILKKILVFYENELDEIISILDDTRRTFSGTTTNQPSEKAEYLKEFEKSTEEFLLTAKKLRNLTGIVKSQIWFQSVKDDSSGVIPHSLALDMRYGTLFKMYQELITPNWSMKFDPQYSYTWKKSSSMYEMWCYIKVCRGLAEKYAMSSADMSLNFEFGNRLFFPFLEGGSCVSFENEEVRLNVYFDKLLPKNERDCTLEENPCYTLGRKNRPDIRIDIYPRALDTPHLMGTLILECKYRKLSSYWFDPENASRGWNPSGSSKPQILSYYNDLRSSLMLVKNASDSNWHPTKKVFVLTPDDNGIRDQRRSGRDKEIENRTLQPTADNYYLNNLLDSISEEISKVCRFEKDLIAFAKNYASSFSQLQD